MVMYLWTINGIINTDDGSQAPDGFYVVKWDDDTVTDGPMPLALAKRYCRGSGHTGEIVNGRYVPVSFVANECGECVYNPRFGTDISAEVGGWANSRESDSF